MFGLTAQGQILSLSHAVLAGEIAAALQQLNELAQKGKDLGRLLGDLLNHFRNLLLFQVSRGDMSLVEVSEAEATALKEQAALATAEGFTRILEVLSDAELRLRDAASKKILLEVALLKAIEARSAVNLDAVLKQLNALRGSGELPVAPAARPAPTSSAAPPAATAFSLKAEAPAAPPVKPAPVGVAPNAAAAPTAAVPADRAELEVLWGQVVEAVKRASPFAGRYLISAHPVSLAKGLFTIGFDPEFEDYLGLVDNAKNHALLQTKFAELGHPHLQFKFIKAEAPEGRVTMPAPVAVSASPSDAVSTANPKSTSAREKPTSVAFNKDEFKDDPLIQKALEIFKGQIVEVRA
jgi:DNA polymerase-3 subunit gamma/tau